MKKLLVEPIIIKSAAQQGECLVGLTTETLSVDKPTTIGRVDVLVTQWDPEGTITSDSRADLDYHLWLNQAPGTALLHKVSNLMVPVLNSKYTRTRTIQLGMLIDPNDQKLISLMRTYVAHAQDSMRAVISAVAKRDGEGPIPEVMDMVVEYGEDHFLCFGALYDASVYATYLLNILNSGLYKTPTKRTVNASTVSVKYSRVGV